MAKSLRELRIPVIDLRGIVPNLGIPFVGVDNLSVAQRAFDHFRSRGFRSFAIVSTSQGYHEHMDQRCRHFKSIAEQAGFPCTVFRDTRFGNPAIDWEEQQKRTAKWLRSLSDSFPIGTLCVNDLIARETIEACHRANLAVPDQVAVMGVDNDTYLCTLSIPPMSSVAVDAPAIGFQAAELLQEMMGSPPKRYKPKQILLPCQEVVVRASTDSIAIDDTIVADALTFIRAEACNGIDVDDVVATTPLCRTLLERRFKKALARTIYKELLRVKLKRAQDLLRTTDGTQTQIAEESGFLSSVYLSQVFRRELKTTPGKWRKQNAVTSS